MSLHDVPKDLIWFNTERLEQTNFAFKCLQALRTGNKYVIIDAPVKSGKREIVFAAALITASENKNIKHIYLTGFYRKDIKIQQHPQYAGYKVEVLYCHTKEHAMKSAIKVKKYSRDYSMVIVHYDESDHGTGEKGSADLFFTTINVGANSRVSVLQYSATNEEVKLSYLPIKEKACILTFEPSPLYKGAKWFLDNDCVFDSSQFYDSEYDTITNHGWDLISDFANSEKYFALLRLTGTENGKSKIQMFEEHEELRQDLALRGIETIFVYGDKHQDWDGDIKRKISLCERAEGKIKYLFVLNQKCSRSTEIFMHEHICWWHEHRSETTTYSTVLQSVGRNFHYHSDGYKYPIYTDKKVLELGARRIAESDFGKESKRNLGVRTVKKTNKINNVIYTIYDCESDIPKEKLVYRNVNSTYWTVSENNVNDLCEKIIKGFTSENGSVQVIYVDKANQNFVDSWDSLMRKYPEMEGKYITGELIGVDKEVTHHAKTGTKNGTMYNNQAWAACIVK